MYFVSAQHLYLFACCVLYFCPPASKRYRNLLTSLSKTHLPKGEQEGRREREGESEVMRQRSSEEGRGNESDRESDWGGLSRNQREYCSSRSDSPCCYRCSSAASLSLSHMHADIDAHAVNTDLYLCSEEATSYTGFLHPQLSGSCFLGSASEAVPHRNAR